MAQETLVDYLGEALEESDFEFDWKLEWNKNSMLLRYIFQFLQNRKKIILLLKILKEQLHKMKSFSLKTQSVSLTLRNQRSKWIII